jgi:hypothetical protein
MAYIEFKISYIRKFSHMYHGNIDKMYEDEIETRLTNEISYDKLKFFIIDLSHKMAVDNHMILYISGDLKSEGYRYCRYNEKLSEKRWVLYYIMDAINKFGRNEFLKLYTLLYNIYYEME